MLDSVCRAISVHFQRCQVFHAHVQLRIFEQRDPYLSQLESHKQDSTDVPIKSNPGSINREIGVAKGLVHHAQSGIQAEVGWCSIMLKPHSVTNGDRNILQQFWKNLFQKDKITFAIDSLR
ncbi:hypothetical protein AVEN_53388-1 [Araneus ventricosus]|uniref:Uncharacterized protein n=1 Tax=Araneus ventricosus TaxID=182803 RepID=A0A4Y2ABQ3_ARAVE|nr:hypothetical protein AVEN_53388-1 [Araneus ventricosus]